MWIVGLALRWPCTFVVLALLILIAGTLLLAAPRLSLIPSIRSLPERRFKSCCQAQNQEVCSELLS